MGSQRAATLSGKKASAVSGKVATFSPRSRNASEMAASVAAASIGSFARTSSFVQCLSNQSVQNALEFLIKFRNEFNIKGETPEKVFQQYDVSIENEHPLGEFTAKARKHLLEVLTAQQRSTESSLAVNDALAQSLLEVMEKHVPKSQARLQSREKIAEFLKREDARNIAKIMMKNTIANLIDRIIDAAGSDNLPEQKEKVKRKIREEFAPRLADKIDSLARKNGIPASKIPTQIPNWVEDLNAFIEKHRI